MKPKQLIWRNGRAETPFGMYQIVRTKGSTPFGSYRTVGMKGLWAYLFRQDFRGNFRTKREAVAAAQADFERRVMECFEGNDDGKN